MRKKSHIDLANYLMDSNPDIEHRISMFVGCILPDIVPNFIYKRHRIDTTLSIVNKEIFKVTLQKKRNWLYCMRIGIISHYVSDYFTLPHNIEYDGNIKQHCVYERDLIYKLREEIKKYKEEINSSAEKYKQVNIIRYIIEKHKEYLDEMSSRVYNIDGDCSYILTVACMVTSYIEELNALNILSEQMNIVNRSLIQAQKSS